jgi:hypothetical protein
MYCQLCKQYIKTPMLPYACYYNQIPPVPPIYVKDKIIPVTPCGISLYNQPIPVVNTNIPHNPHNTLWAAIQAYF